MQLHKYRAFDIEMIALKSWVFSLYKIKHGTGNSEKALDIFLDWYCPTPYWAFYKFPDPATMPTKQEKILYLSQYLKMPKQQIAKVLSASPNYVLKTINESKAFQYKEDIQKEFLLKEYAKLRPLLPDEIFIKNL